MRRRWEDDERGTGVASAAPLTDDVATFLAAARDEGWVAEEPLLHLRPKLDAWLADADDRPWRDVTVTTDGPWLVIRGVWTADRRLRDLRADAYALLGSFAEGETFVRQRGTAWDRTVVFEVATGLPDATFAPHGHLVRLEVLGLDVERAADGTTRIGETPSS